MISASMVKELRQMTGAGMMDCKRALQETNGDMDKAVELLREKGLAAAAKGWKNCSRGIRFYIHMGGKIGVLVESIVKRISAKTDNSRPLSGYSNACAAANPQYLSKEDVTEVVIAKEKEILKAQALNVGKPEKIAEKIVEGRIEKYFKEVCLLEQPFVKDPDKSIQDYVNEQIATIGEKISIRRFVRYQMGEGLEKRQDNFAEEVMSQMKG